ncbi:MAG: hypothetical protein IE928_09595 [Gammaproteobacteria bacterium]|jgi:hypothetical protein|nr:hypothetical protein [Gammaproteobacteria bacterium]
MSHDPFDEYRKSAWFRAMEEVQRYEKLLNPYPLTAAEQAALEYFKAEKEFKRLKSQMDAFDRSRSHINDLITQDVYLASTRSYMDQYPDFINDWIKVQSSLEGALAMINYDQPRAYQHMKDVIDITSIDTINDRLFGQSESDLEAETGTYIATGFEARITLGEVTVKAERTVEDQHEQRYLDSLIRLLTALKNAFPKLSPKEITVSDALTIILLLMAMNDAMKSAQISEEQKKANAAQQEMLKQVAEHAAQIAKQNSESINLIPVGPRAVARNKGRIREHPSRGSATLAIFTRDQQVVVARSYKRWRYVYYNDEPTNEVRAGWIYKNSLSH